jgi:hypothetical protein
MAVLLAILAGLGIGVVLIALMVLTGPWWLPIVDPYMNRLMDWTERRIEQRNKGGEP